MRLQTAMSIDEFQGLEDEDFGLFRSKEERQERRAARKAKRKKRRERRKSRRAERKERRHERKASRLRRKARKLDPGGGRRRRGGGGGGGAPSSPRRAMRRGRMKPMRRRQQQPFDDAPMDMEAMEPTLEPAPMSPSPELGPEFYEPFDPSEFEEEDFEMEGMGAVATRWSPLVRMGPTFRIQAAQGYRAAVVPLKPGLFLVAELPEHVARSEFGIAPLLAPLVVRAASRAITKPPEQRLLPRLLKRRQQGQGQQQDGGQRRAFLQRVFRPNQGQGRPMLPMLRRQGQAQRQLVPAPGSGQGQNQLLPAPVLGRWVDHDDLAGLFGCPDDEDCG